MVSGYTHGWLKHCRKCFTSDEKEQDFNGFTLINNPGYAGSSSPRILILGFSKGATQIEAAKRCDYDIVPFKGMRTRLQEVLEKLELMPLDRTIDEMITAEEKEFGGASLVRCSLCKKKDDNCITSGSIVTSSFTIKKIEDVIKKCTFTYLSDPPDSIECVLLLGTNNVYIQRTKQLFWKLYPNDFQDINEVAFRARNALWIYVAHPSPANGRFKCWRDSDEINPSGKKRILARDTLRTLYTPQNRILYD